MVSSTSFAGGELANPRKVGRGTSSWCISGVKALAGNAYQRSLAFTNSIKSMVQVLLLPGV
jgi:hypothetical protein